MKPFLYFLSLITFSGAFANETMNVGQKTPVSDYQAVQVKNTLTKKSKDLQNCWLEYLKVKNSLKKGNIIVDWRVSVKGETTKVEIVKNDFNDENFGNCIIKKIKTYDFPPPKQDEYIAHTFSFATDEELLKMKNSPVEIHKSVGK